MENPQARFVSGSIARHVIVMTLTGAIGLMALFLVDFADLYFLALLGQTEITSAIGFAGTLAFASLSVSIGIGIAATALVARNLGANRPEAAKSYGTSALIVSAIAPLFVATGLYVFAEQILYFLGARDATLGYAMIYLKTVTLGFPLLGAALCCSFILRAIGDARRAMYVTLATAVGNAVLDPILIFGFDLSIRGAAIATICANALSFGIGFYGVWKVHCFLCRFDFSRFATNLKAITAIALPASATQLATPFAVGYMTWATAPFGDEAVAGTAIVNRLVPVAFGIVFSLSGAVGPIIGQNFGAGNFLRLRETLNKSMLFNLAYTTSVAAILWLLRDKVPGWFLAKGDAVRLIVLFCSGLSLSWTFAGAQFVAQAAFNNLGKTHWSMYFNWGKAIFGTIPFIWLGTKWWGFTGILAGYSAGTVVFGLFATIAVYRFVNKLERIGQHHQHT